VTDKNTQPKKIEAVPIATKTHTADPDGVKTKFDFPAKNDNSKNAR